MPGISETRHWLGAKSLRYTVAVGRGAAAQGHRQVFAVSPPHHVLVRGRRGSSASANRLPPSNSTYDLWSHNNLTTPPVPPFSAHCPFPAPTINCRHHQAAAPRAPPTNSQHTRYRPSARNIVVRLFPQSVRLHRSGKFSSPPGPGASPRPPPTDPARPHPHPEAGPLACTGPPRGSPPCKQQPTSPYGTPKVQTVRPYR